MKYILSIVSCFMFMTTFSQAVTEGKSIKNGDYVKDSRVDNFSEHYSFSSQDMSVVLHIKKVKKQEGHSDKKYWVDGIEGTIEFNSKKLGSEKYSLIGFAGAPDMLVLAYQDTKRNKLVKVTLKGNKQQVQLKLINPSESPKKFDHSFPSQSELTLKKTS